MIEMEALSRQNYNGTWYLRGQVISVENKLDHDDMIAMHLARPIFVLQAQPASVLPGKQDRSMETEQIDTPFEENEEVSTEDKPVTNMPTDARTAKQNRNKNKATTPPYNHREMRPS